MMKLVKMSVLVLTVALTLSACKKEEATTEVQAENTTIKVDEQAGSVEIKTAGDNATISVNNEQSNDAHSHNDELDSDDEDGDNTESVNADSVTIDTKDGIKIEAGNVNIGGKNGLVIDTPDAKVDLSQGLNVETEGVKVDIGEGGLKISSK